MSANKHKDYIPPKSPARGASEAAVQRMMNPIFAAQNPFFGIAPEEVKGAILTEDRFIAYTSYQYRKGRNVEFFVFYRKKFDPESQVMKTDVVGVYTKDKVLEYDIEGIIPQLVDDGEDIVA